MHMKSINLFSLLFNPVPNIQPPLGFMVPKRGQSIFFYLDYFQSSGWKKDAKMLRSLTFKCKTEENVLVMSLKFVPVIQSIL